VCGGATGRSMRCQVKAWRSLAEPVFFLERLAEPGRSMYPTNGPKVPMQAHRKADQSLGRLTQETRAMLGYSVCGHQVPCHRLTDALVCCNHPGVQKP
jgi:hypothetical protein